jgi:hypothetical protein
MGVLDAILQEGADVFIPVQTRGGGLDALCEAGCDVELACLRQCLCICC